MPPPGGRWRPRRRLTCATNRGWPHPTLLIELAANYANMPLAIPPPPGGPMAFEPGNRFGARSSAIPQVDIDVGLRQHMLRVYNYMVLGLAITGLVAYFAATTGFYASIAHTPLIWVVMLAPLAFVLVLSYGI